MTYIENIFVLLIAPLAASLLCLRKSSRSVIAWLLIGMAVCLISAYISMFLSHVLKLDAVRTAVEIAPEVEELAKLLPVLAYLAILDPEEEEVQLAFIMVAVGFATMESAFCLGASELSNPMTLLMRGLGSATMHVMCAAIVGYGLMRAWRHAWLRAAGSFGMLCLAMAYHGIFNLLIAAGGIAQVAAIALPLMSCVVLFAARRRVFGAQTPTLKR